MDLKASPSKDSPLLAGRTVHPRIIVDQTYHESVEAIRGWRVGNQNAGGKVVKESLDVPWRALRWSAASSPSSSATSVVA